MTKLKLYDFENLLKTGAPDLKAVLFYGQDEGLIEECRQRMITAIIPDKDPFRLSELTFSQIKEDPALL